MRAARCALSFYFIHFSSFVAARGRSLFRSRDSSPTTGPTLLQCVLLRSCNALLRSSTLLQCSSTFFYALAMDAFFYALAMDAFLVLEMRVQGVLHTFSSFVAVRFVSLIRSRDARGLSGRPGAAAGEGVSLPVLPRFAAFSRGFAVFHCACCRSTSSRCLPPPSNPTACCRQILPCMMLNGSPLHRPSLTAAFPLARFCRG